MATNIMNLMNSVDTRDDNTTDLLKIVRYNLHGLNQGLPGIEYLMDELYPDIIVIQEHWQVPDNLKKLSEISSNNALCLAALL